MPPFSRPEKGGRHDADAVPAPVGALARTDHDRVEEIGADPVSKPKEILDVAIDDVARELRLDSEHAPVGSLDDQIDFVLACSRAQQRAEKRPVAWDRRGRGAGFGEAPPGDSAPARGASPGGEVLLCPP